MLNTDVSRGAFRFKAAVIAMTCFILSSVASQAEIPTERFVPLPLGQVTPEGWLRAQLSRDLESGYLGHFDELLQHRRTGEYILQDRNNDYVTRARNKDSRHNEQGLTIPAAPQAWWDAEMIADWQDALIRTAFLTGNSKARQKADRFIASLLNSQDEDGYIGIYPKGFRYHFASADGELWTQRCAFLSMLAYYEFTGRKDVLNAVERAVKLTMRQYDPGHNYFDNPKQPNSGVSHGLLFVDVLEWLHRITGDEEYRRFAVYLYDSYSSSKLVANKAAQLGRLLDKDQPLGGHGPDIMGFLRVPLMSYYMTGKADYRTAWDNSILKLERHLGVGGSPLSGNNEEIMTANQTPSQPYEFCSTFYLLHTLTWAMQKHGNPHYSDLLENTLFNAAQGARFSDGKALTYYSADERLWVRQTPPEGTGNHRYIYTAAFYPSCCHNSGGRSYPYAISSMWMKSTGPEGEGLAAVLYGPSKVETTVAGVPVKISEQTDYPFGFTIRFIIEPDRPVSFPIRLRVPNWSSEHRVSARGAKVSRDDLGYVVVQKEWKAGDRIELKLVSAIQDRKAVDGTSTLAYGPLVFSLPVPEKPEIVQRFPEAEAKGLRGFYGYQYDPADLSSAKRPLKLSSGKPGFGFKIIHDRKANALYPWDRSPLQLQGKMIGAGGKPEKLTLLPMGCTILRRTCFPKF
jgi:DUF1680 family protein